MIVKSRRGLVSVNIRPAGTISETTDGYTFPMTPSIWQINRPPPSP